MIQPQMNLSVEVPTSNNRNKFQTISNNYTQTLQQDRSSFKSFKLATATKVHSNLDLSSLKSLTEYTKKLCQMLTLGKRRIVLTHPKNKLYRITITKTPVKEL